MNLSGKNLSRIIIDSAEEMNEIMRSTTEDYGAYPVHVGLGAEYVNLAEWKAKNPQFKNITFTSICLVEVKDTKLEFTSKWGERNMHKPTTYIFDLNGADITVLSGRDCYAVLQKYYKIPEATSYEDPDIDAAIDPDTKKYIGSASPLIGYNPRYQGQELHNVYEYDLNSAYTNVLLNKIPDLYHPMRNDLVGEGQVGFMLDEQLTMIDTIGLWADVIFDLIDTPENLKRYCMKYYNMKKEASAAGNEKEKLKAKAYLNYPIGYSQRKNPFLRAYVVHNCNKIIKELLDENSVIWNTDAIFSLVRRDDLVIGKEIGQFKEIYCETLRYKGNTYQIGNDLPVYRGICKQWFKAFEKESGRPYNILIDQPPRRVNVYEFVRDTLKLEENPLWKQ